MSISGIAITWSSIVASIIALTSVAFAFGQIRYQSGRNTRITDGNIAEISRLQGRMIVMEKTLHMNQTSLNRLEDRLDKIIFMLKLKDGDAHNE